jgi:hypothetical protein
MSLQTRTILELKSQVYQAFINANKRQSVSYALTLKMLSKMPNELALEVRGVNGGDIAEALLKYVFIKQGVIKNATLTYSRQNLKDLNKGGANEVKYFGASNNTPNGTLTPKAFYGISKYGVHHFTYDIVKEYFNEFKLDERKGTRAMTYALMNKLVQEGQVKRLDEVSKALGL